MIVLRIALLLLLPLAWGLGVEYLFERRRRARRTAKATDTSQ
ncbi:MAG: hypothetical protein ACOC7R_02645 [Planctomycetota bacterium]